MRFATSIFAAVVLASSALAQTAGFSVITSPTQDEQIPAGSSFDVIWTPGTPTGPVSIILLQGDTAGTLQIGATLATGVPSTLGKFTFSVPTTASFKTYGFKISLDSDPSIFQYSFPFHISGGSSSSSSSATGSATSASSVSSTVTGVTTSIHVSSTSSAVVSTSASTTAKPITSTTAAPATTAKSNSTTAAVPVSTPASNSTTLVTSSTGSKTSSASGSSTSTPAIVTPNAAVAKVASMGLALGGMVMAFAL